MHAAVLSADGSGDPLSGAAWRSDEVLKWRSGRAAEAAPSVCAALEKALIF